MFDTLAVQIGAIFVVAVCAFALLQGDQPERLVGGAFILAWFASLLLQGMGGASSVHWGLMALDIAMFALLCFLAWKTNAIWPAWAAACQVLVVLSHFVSLLGLRPEMSSFIAAINLAGYGVLLALGIGIGTFWAWQERKAAEFK